MSILPLIVKSDKRVAQPLIIFNIQHLLKWQESGETQSEPTTTQGDSTHIKTVVAETTIQGASCSSGVIPIHT